MLLLVITLAIQILNNPHLTFGPRLIEIGGDCTRLVRDSDLDEKMAGFSRQKVKSAHDFTPGRSHLGVMRL